MAVYDKVKALARTMVPAQKQDDLYQQQAGLGGCCKLRPPCCNGVQRCATVHGVNGTGYSALWSVVQNYWAAWAGRDSD